MRIVVNDIAAISGGGLTVLESFYRYVREVDVDHEWVFLLGSDLLEESTRVRTIVLPRVKSTWLRRLAFDIVSGRRLIDSLRPDVVLSLQNTYTYGVAAPQVVYVHQSLPFQGVRNFSILRREERTLAVYQHVIGAIIKQSIRSADHVIVQTNWMRDAILDQVSINNENVTTILPDLDDMSAHEFDGERDPGAFFYPTSRHVYKNNDLIYKACHLLRQHEGVNFNVAMTLDEAAIDPNVMLIGRVPRSRVLEYLSRSTLLFPSYVETYGLPLAEARALGSIVLAADIPYAREVLDGYQNAYFFDAASPHELADLMRRVAMGNILRKEQGPQAEHTRLAGRAAAWGRVVRILEDQVAAGGRP